MLISGSRQSGIDIDVYLAPLIKDLSTLCDDGVQVYDSHCQENLSLRGICFMDCQWLSCLRYNLFGCVVKGYNACHIYNENNNFIILKHFNKNTYTSYWTLLPQGHGKVEKCI